MKLVLMVELCGLAVVSFSLLFVFSTLSACSSMPQSLEGLKLRQQRQGNSSQEVQIGRGKRIIKSLFVVCRFAFLVTLTPPPLVLNTDPKTGG